MTDADLTAVARRLADVESALERLEEGTYGRCGSCGEPIGGEALEADPLAGLCERCQVPG